MFSASSGCLNTTCVQSAFLLAIDFPQKLQVIFTDLFSARVLINYAKLLADRTCLFYSPC